RRSHVPTPPLPRPPLPTLLPYTTLFRSDTDLDAQSQQGKQAPAATAGGRGRQAAPPAPAAAMPGATAPAAPVTTNLDFLATAAPDRKSTRLNSSHVAISYAVFCLKKKTD